jgi:hypothetical protein
MHPLDPRSNQSAWWLRFLTDAGEGLYFIVI